jgi:hypothetical protein
MYDFELLLLRRRRWQTRDAWHHSGRRLWMWISSAVLGVLECEIVNHPCILKNYLDPIRIPTAPQIWGSIVWIERSEGLSPWGFWMASWMKRMQSRQSWGWRRGHPAYDRRHQIRHCSAFSSSSSPNPWATGSAVSGEAVRGMAASVGSFVLGGEKNGLLLGPILDRERQRAPFSPLEVVPLPILVRATGSPLMRTGGDWGTERDLTGRRGRGGR